MLDPSNFKVALEKARAQLTQADAQVTRARAQVAQREAAAQRANANLEKAQSDYDRDTALYQQDVKAVSKADVDAATAALHSAEGESGEGRHSCRASSARCRPRRREQRASSLRLTGAGEFESADFGLLFNPASRFWQIGPSLTMPIFEGGRNVANLQAARTL